MRRSKLEIHLDILKTLAQKGPLKLTHIMYKANINCSILKEYIEFLKNHDLVEEMPLRKQKIVFKITEKGKSVLVQLQKIQTILPISDGEITLPLTSAQNKTYFLKNVP